MQARTHLPLTAAPNAFGRVLLLAVRLLP